MEGESTEEKAELFVCLKILFKNFVKGEDIRQLANVLKKNDVISEGQEKKVYTACKNKEFDTAVQKLINFAETKFCGDFKNLENALQEKDFPADEEAKTLISHLVRIQDKNWIFIVKNLENLAQCDMELKPLITGDGAGDKDWFKVLLFAAFNEIFEEKEDQPIYDAVKIVLLKLEQPAECDLEQSAKSMPIKLKRTGPTESSSSSESGENASTEQEKSDLKRGHNDVTEKSETKKHKSLDDQIVPSSSSDTSSPEGNATDENIERATKSTSETGSEGDHSEHVEGQEKKSHGKRSLETSDKSITQERISGDESPRSETTANSDISDSASSPVSSSNNSQSEEESDEKGKVGPTQEKDGSHSPQSAVDKDSTNVKEGDNQEDAEKEQGPMTRSKTKGKETSTSEQHTSDSRQQEPHVTLLQTDVWPTLEDDNARFVEIRAVVSGSQTLPSGTPLSMIFAENGWKPMEMAFNERKQFYFLRLMFSPGHGKFFKFKFCHKTEREQDIVYEKLPGDHRAKVNREIHFENGETKWKIDLNVCLFQSSHSWTQACCNEMMKFFPHAKVLGDLQDTDNDTSVLTDIFCWINCVKYGWQLDVPPFYTHWNPTWPQVNEFEGVLVKWLNGIYDSESKNTTAFIHMAKTALAISVSFAYEKHIIRLNELLLLLLKMLRIDGLDATACKNLYNMVLKERQAAANNGLTLPTFREAILWLYEHIPEKPNLEWMLTLPLFWLMIHGDIRNQVLKPDSSRNLIYARSSLPSNFNWSQVWQNCQWSTSLRKEIFEITPDILEISKLHPWIIGTYQFMLNSREFAALIFEREKHKIAQYFPADAALHQYLDGYSQGHFKHHKSEEDSAIEKYFKECLDSAVTKTSDIAEVSEEQKMREFGTCQTMLDIVTKYLKPAKGQLRESEDILWCLDIIVMKTLSWAILLNLDKNNMKKLDEKLTTLLRIVTTGIHRRNKVEKFDVEYWGKLLNIEWEIPDFSTKWKKEIVQEIENSISNFCSGCNNGGKKNDEGFLDFYVEGLGDMSLQVDVEKCLNDKAYQCTDEMLTTPQQGKGVIERFFTSVKALVTTAKPPRIVQVFEKLFKKEYQKFNLKGVSPQDVAVRFLCNWSFSAQFFELFVPWLKSFEPHIQTLIQEVSKNFKAVVKSLVTETIIVDHLDVILTHKGRFLQVWSVLSQHKEEDSSPSAEDLNQTIDRYSHYLKVFKRTRAAVEDFIHVCNYIDYDREIFPHGELQYKAKMKVQKSRVCDLVMIGDDDEPNSTDFFGITDEQLAEFKKISFLKDSKEIFREMFVEAAKGIEIDVEGDNPWIELLQVFRNVKHQIFYLVERTDSGTITMDSVIKRFKILEGKKEDIDCEVDLFYDFYSKYRRSDLENDEVDDEEVDMLENREDRKKQIFNTFELQSANEAVDVLLDLRDMLNLEGDFSILTQRKKMIEDQDTVKLDEVPETLEIPEICSFDSGKLTILRKFMGPEEVDCSQRQVIEWLQTKMKNGVNDVQVLCDLAMISAGGNPIEVDRVSMLLSAVMGFSSLIFWTKDERKKAGSKLLLERCRKVWEDSKNTDNLLENWDETSHQLQWFKEVEKFYGSVEKSSLIRAQEVNERGVYRISKQLGNGTLAVEKCVSLVIPGKTERDSDTKLTLDQLHELQSKLMLIAGEAEKGQQDVKVFVEVLTSVQKLAEVFVQLLSSGCMLFARWEAIIMCNSGRPLSIQIAFIDDAEPIIGHGTHSEVDKLTELLKESLAKWSEHISSKRMEYYHLNEYNIQQIMYLCRELANLDELEGIPEQAQSLLSFVGGNFDIEELKNCLQGARRNMKQSYEMEIDNAEHRVGNENPMEDDEMGLQHQNENRGSVDENDTKKKLKAVHQLLSQEDIREDEAKAAVQVCGCDDLEACIEWILLHGMDEELVIKHSREFDDIVDFIQEDRKSKVMHSVFNRNSENTLKDVISRLQTDILKVDAKDFLNCVKTVCAGYLDETIAMNLQDHLSIGLLGTLLNKLSKEGEIHRKLLPGLQPGQPNLLICGEEEILPTMLSLYMHNEDQSLPTRSEVLICDVETQSEEVERFLRRATCDSGNGDRLLYTLAFADKLSYSTSSKVEVIFNKLSKSGRVDEKYQLVIFLCKQQHYLTTCFDKYVVDGKWSQRTKRIQSYLKRHLQVVETETSAASVTQGNYMVKVVTSTRSGVGKSLYVRRLNEELQETDIESRSVTIRLLENKLDLNYVIEKLNQTERRNRSDDAVLAHVDLTPAVQRGIEAFAFNLFVLGSIQGYDGTVWKTHQNHLYVVEMTDFGTTGEKRFSSRHILNLLPYVKCNDPHEVLNATVPADREWLGMDEAEFQSETFQRPFQYLRRYQNDEDLDEFTYAEPDGSHRECIEVLLRHCCIENPSWAQLRHFCSFLNVQLENCEKSLFCTHPHIKPHLAGLKVFAVNFMIKMAQDFATPSLRISDKSMKDSSMPQENNQNGFQAHQIRRKWEETSHPYVFFNEDGQTMTFINVKINADGYLVAQNGDVSEERVATPQLVSALQRQGFDLIKNFDDFPRSKKLRFLRQVLGKMEVFDPDPTYELTTDNVLKILAIYMRFRCQIPVIIMGETGCGKTRLVEFMSKLKLKARNTATEAELPRNGKNSAGEREEVKNMITLKIHGGISVKNIHESVEEAKLTEIQNRENGDDFTVLFYDEANTTEAIYAIREVMCDKSIDGKSFGDSKLKIVAACNPYKKLSDEALKKLEESGLGYRIRTSETAHLFGNIPVRSLVYRVVALPPSMQPFVWDFGQLSDDAEKIYIQQMTRKLAEKLGLTQQATAMINDVLSSCQQYMRTRRDECRYVSLRDVERCMTTYEWFHTRQKAIYPAVEREIRERFEKMYLQPPAIDDEVRTLIQTIGVCYHASLDKREEFRIQLVRCLDVPGVNELYIETELLSCQTAFLQNIRIGDNIACNEALRENVFMMAVCADMRIPLFLIGKPGSSKSLAKTIVANNMQGRNSRAPLYRQLKQIHILSYQCSVLTDAEGIERMFTQCSQLQKKQNPDAYTAVVVLDEIGLAEDSPNMPLKVLHPLLERRSTDLNTVAHPDTERVGFVGISNWALDPAKMNRGIFLTRNQPSKRDLRKTGKEIFQSKPALWRDNSTLFESLTSTYLKMYEQQNPEYFGLRDYYSLMKMICSRCDKTDIDIKFLVVVYAVLRNFSGGKYQVAERFLEKVKEDLQISEHEPIPIIPIQRMIMDNLSETESRFLLLLANQFSVVSLLELCIENSYREVVFGSSFPGDHSYTEICRNINRIKVCMESGKTVILLNMAKIHESLYDALNQHFVTFGGQNYVDLGLGGHRVKCRIAHNFRLIVIERKDVVHREYPIPLINRLEKHYFNSDSLLDAGQRSESKKLTKWALKFVKNDFLFTSRHAFVGFHDDTISSIVLTTEGDLDDYKSVLLQSCSMDAILRLPDSNLHANEVDYLQKIYFTEQHHHDLADVLKSKILLENPFSVVEITSFSSVLSKSDVDQLHSELNLQKGSIILLSLEQFYTQQEYSDRLDKFFERCSRRENTGTPLVLLIQCAKAQSQAPLIACARHCLMNKIRIRKSDISETGNVTVALLLSTEREGTSRSKMDALALQPTPETQIIHVDEMRPTDDHIASASNFFGKSLREVFEAGMDELESGRRSGSLVNIRSLLIDCICESVAKVKGQVTENERYLKRVKILMNLCSSDEIAGDNFRKIFLRKVVQIVSEMEEEDQGITNWVTDKANDRESLQEGGTFRKTLWLCLKGHISRFMAYFISIIDRRDNMDLIAKIPAVPWEQHMWLGMFNQLETSWQNIKGGIKSLAPGSQKQSRGKLPFSFLAIDYLETQWHALKPQRSENFEESFFRLFQDFGMKTFFTKALDFAKINVMKNFASDLIGVMYPSATEDPSEVAIIEKAVFDLAMTKLQGSLDEDYFSKGDEIAVIFLIVKALSERLEQFSEILQGCPQVLDNWDSWSKEQGNSEEFVLHILAFKDVLNLLKQKSGHVEGSKICIEWIDLARTVRKMFDSVTGFINDVKVLEELKKNWLPLSLLDLLLLQLLPPAHSDDVLFQNFVKVIAPQAKLFQRASITADARSYNFLRIVLSVLKRCYTDINTQLLLDWRKMDCRICGRKVNTPTFLPCGHFGCEKCIQQHITSSGRCMTCPAQIPRDFIPHPAELDEDGIKISKNLKSNCTSFFLEYLQHFCFKNTGGVADRMEQHVKQILKLLIVQSFDGDEQKELDPTGLDLDVNTKSCMMQILLHHNQDLVMEQLNQALDETEENTRNSLIMVILKHSEQKILTKSSKFTDNKEKTTKFWQGILGSSCRGLLSLEETAELNVEVLQKVAELRCALMHFVSLIDELQQGVEFVGDEKVEVETFFHFGLDLLRRDNMPQVVRDFVIKAGCRKFGTQWLQQMAKHQELWVLIPPTLRQAAEGCNVDHWALLSREYTRTNSELYQIDAEDARREVAAILDHATGDLLPHVLALTSWSDKKERDVKDMVAGILRQNYGGNNFVVRFLVEKKEVLKFLLETNLATPQQASILYQLILLVVAATTAQNDIMRGFYDIVVDPQTTRGRFLPSMPEDVYFATPADYRSRNMDQTSMYKCPRGHLYSIGNCTRPYVTARCPECQSTIGGTGHRAAAGNIKIVKTEQSEAGYKFPDGGNVTTGAERMSPQGATVTQFLLNSCLLLGSLDNGPSVASILHLQCFNVQQAQQFLIQQLQANLRQLSTSLARNIDDTVLVLHRILRGIINQGPRTHVENWATLEARRTWEQTFRRVYLLPVFQNLETEITKADRIMSEAEEAGSAPLNRLIHEIPDDEEPIPDSSWEEKSLWNLIEHPSSAHLIQVLEDKMEENSGEVLQIIMQTPDLDFAKFLENVLRLQQKLTERYQYQIDMNNADQMTFRNHIEDGGHSDENEIKEYISAWNKVYKNLQGVAPDYLSKYFKPISMDSSLSMALPSIRGRGQCAKILAEYLIEIQNQFLTRCVEVIKPAQKLKEVEVQQLRSTDFVCINKQKDLLNLINMHTSYTITSDDQGRHHAISYNIEALEKQVREKFVMCKKSVKKNSIPCMTYPQDIGIGSDWQKVEVSVPQELLTAKLSQDIDRTVEKSHSSEVCEAVRTLTNAISFLAMVKADPSKTLCEFLEKDLKLPSSRTSIILRSAQISHVLSLYQRLTWHKAVIFVQQGLDPYKEALSGIAQELISDEVLVATLEAFENSDVIILQQRINEMLITGTGIDNSDWTLTEDVFPYLQFLDKSEDDSWYSKLPEELCNKHLGDLFRLSVEKQMQN